MSGWNQAPLPRDQVLLFPETLGDRIPQNHSVRLFAEILDTLDWSNWERHYVLVAGQPPIHPQVMAGAILHGLSHGLRSSRRLEWACANAVDFMWLAEGRTIDHSTFCEFRTKFKAELEDLFGQIGRVAMCLGLIRLNQVALDGTRVRANSSPHATASAKTPEERLKVLDEQIEKMLVEAANKADARRAKRKSSSKRAAKVPVADPDSAIMPNKEGGYAPNFNFGGSWD